MRGDPNRLRVALDRLVDLPDPLLPDLTEPKLNVGVGLGSGLNPGRRQPALVERDQLLPIPGQEEVLLKGLERVGVIGVGLEPLSMTLQNRRHDIPPVSLRVFRYEMIRVRIGRRDSILESKALRLGLILIRSFRELAGRPTFPRPRSSRGSANGVPHSIRSSTW